MLSKLFAVTNNDDEPLFFVVKSVRGGPPMSFEGQDYALMVSNIEDKIFYWTIQLDYEHLKILNDVIELCGIERVVIPYILGSSQFVGKYDVVVKVEIDENLTLYVSEDISDNTISLISTDEDAIIMHISKIRGSGGPP